MSRDWIVPAALLLAAAIHLAPLPGVFGAVQLASLYGLTGIDDASELLLRHRALMFGLDGALLLLALLKPHLRMTAIALTLASDIGFLLLATTTTLSLPLQRVAAFDALAIVALALALLQVVRSPAPIKP